MIAGNGLRSLVDAKVDFSDTKNLLVVSITLGVGLGIAGMSLVGDATGNSAFKIMAGQVEISALAISTLLAIILNLIIPNTKPEDLEINDESIVNLGVASGVEGRDIVKEETKEEGQKENKKRFYWVFKKNKKEEDK